MILSFGCVLLLTSSATAIPVRSRQTPTHPNMTLQDALTNAYFTYLDSLGVTTSKFLPLQAGLEPQFMVGNVSEGADNDEISLAADYIPAWQPDAWSFSNNYLLFVRELLNTTSENNAQSNNSALATIEADVRTKSEQGLNMVDSGGHLIPYYSIPSLESTLTSWQKDPIDISPAIFWANSGTPATPPLTLPFTRSLLGNTSVAAVEISLQRLALVDVERGTWFDDFKIARAVADLPSNDTSAAAQKDIFVKYFGTTQVPGPAAMYMEKALVVYNPEIVLGYSTVDTYFDAINSITTHGPTTAFMWQNTSGNDTNRTACEIRVAPNTQNAYIVGGTFVSYWDAPASGSNSTLTNSTSR
ncbi:hypothetical protein B0H11DRAFT_2209856 [Mycena galericulata]|nr:hypothetical protein B0H11DRAFT_2209856 [Mycena galericulata]